MRAGLFALVVALVGSLSVRASAQDGGHDASVDRNPVPGLCPNVLVILDNSCSMSQAAGDGGVSKWTAAVNAITALGMADSMHLRLGLSLFPCPTCAASCVNPTLAQAIAVEPGNNTLPAVQRALMRAVRVCSTPTGQYIDAVVPDPALNDPMRNSYALLLTDGQPTCGGAGMTNIAYTVTAINNLRAIGVKTFVVGFDANVNAAALDQFAIAGGEPLPASAPHRFYGATDEASLQAAFAAIAQTVSDELGPTLCDESCYTQGCPTGQVCTNATCVADPCASVTCPAGQYCAHGMCTAPCLSGCPTGTICQNGACVTDPCASAGCSGCVNGMCPGPGCLVDGGGVMNCGAGRICEGNTCVEYPCWNVHCPTGTTCDHSGGCAAAYLPDSGTMDGGVVMDSGTGSEPHGATRDAGCACSLARNHGRTPLALLAALAATLVVRRRRRAAS